MLTCGLIWLMTFPLADAEWLTQARFEQALARPLLVNGKPTEIIDILTRLANERQIAISLDRRINPAQQVDITFNATTYEGAITQLAQQARAEVRVVGDALFITPREAAKTLRTRIELLNQQLDEVCQQDRRRQLQLLRRRRLHWDRLSTPAEILNSIAAEHELRITGLELVPHDLWREGNFPSATVNEALLIVLTQFELEAVWIDPDDVRIQAATPDPLLQQHHRPRNMSLQAAVALIAKELPTVLVKQAGRELVVHGLVEEHAQIAVLIGEKKGTAPVSRTPDAIPIEKRRFTLRMVRQPFLALVNSLKAQGIDVNYDEQVLNRADIDLTHKISLELKEATIEELMSAACEEIGLKFTVQGLTIELSPR